MISTPQTLAGKVATFIAAIALAFAAGAWTGYQFKSGRDAEAEVKKAEVVARESQIAFNESAVKSIAIEVKNDAAAANTKVITKLVTQRIKEKSNETSCSVADWSLDHGTVSLLNAARANVPADTAAISDAKSKAPSGVGAVEFVENDLEVTRLYHDLAARHDALVDYVQSKTDTQAK